MTEDDAIRDLVHAIKGNDVANEALDRLADCRANFNGDDDLIAERWRERIAIERTAR